jgi:hypothetical protein
MSCYTRHLASVFAEANLDNTQANRAAVDRILRDLLGMRDANCAEVWRELKRWLDEPSPRALVVEDLRRHAGAVQPTA